MKVILVDDELIALELLGIMLKPYKNIKIVGAFTDPKLALKEAEIIKPDVIFLDIEMGEIDGLEFAERIQKCLDFVQIVFITAYSRYAIEAFEINALDYLLKPIQEERLAKTLARVEKNILGTEAISNHLEVSFFENFRITNEDNRPVVWRTQKSKELFAFLLNSEGMKAHKINIMEMIFPDKDYLQGKSLLHTTMYQLRKSLERLGFPNSIDYLNESYQLNIPLVSDVNLLEGIINSTEYKEEKIRDLLEIYKGDFLEQEGYHWAIQIQTKYKKCVAAYLKSFVLKKIAEDKLTQILKDSLDKMYQLEPFDDSIARLNMEYYYRLGKGFELKRFYNNYVKNLWKEMKLKPSRDVAEFYEKCVKDY